MTCMKKGREESDAGSCVRVKDDNGRIGIRDKGENNSHMNKAELKIKLIGNLPCFTKLQQ